MNKNELSRREFLTKSGLVVAATAVGAAGLGFVSVAQQQAPDWPFPYKELDPDKAAQIGYDGYMNGFN